MESRRPVLANAMVHAARLPRLVLKGLVRFYQYALSPHMPSACRYAPSCSEYAVEALEKYGALKGTVLIVRRLLRCAPWGRGGYDPPRWFNEGRRNEKEATERP